MKAFTQGFAFTVELQAFGVAPKQWKKSQFDAETTPNDEERKRLLENIAELGVQQGNYHFAAKKFTQAGDKLQVGLNGKGEPVGRSRIAFRRHAPHFHTLRRSIKLLATRSSVSGDARTVEIWRHSENRILREHSQK